MRKSFLLAWFTTFIILTLIAAPTTYGAPGKWKLLQSSIGISAMHMQLLPNDRVVIFDRTNFGPSNLTLPKGHCRKNPVDLVDENDCTAHSAEYNVLTNTVRPLKIFTDTWCSSGALFSNGILIQTGGSYEGERVVRAFTPCQNFLCDWKELGNQLLVKRWYSSNHRLPNGQIIIVGGREQFNYEYYPKTPTTNTLHYLPFLNQTIVPFCEDNLYPFVFLNVDGNLFIFANNRAILLNYHTSVVVRTYPTIPGGQPRSYPSTGSAVLLPLKNIDSAIVEAEVLVCGGAPTGSFLRANNSFIYDPALDTCARIKITDTKPKWTLEKMPMPRTMSDMLLLPTGRVIIINGMRLGAAGFGNARDPVLTPVLYDPEGLPRSRFEVQVATKIPRVYHSTAILLRDARVLVAGGNTNNGYYFTNVTYPTELSIEAFSPVYLSPSNQALRPMITSPVSQSKVAYGVKVVIQFHVSRVPNKSKVRVTMIAPPFNTHSFSQGQRMLVLTQVGIVTNVSNRKYQVVVRTPSSKNLALPGYYLLFVVHQGIPGEGIWVHLQ